MCCLKKLSFLVPCQVFSIGNNINALLFISASVNYNCAVYHRCLHFQGKSLLTCNNLLCKQLMKNLAVQIHLDQKAFSNQFTFKINKMLLMVIVRYFNLIGRKRPKQSRPQKTGAIVCRVSFSPCEAQTWFVGWSPG